MKRIAFLYSELAGYTVACLKALQAVEGVEVHVCHWPVQAEAPFDLGALPFRTQPREALDREGLARWVEEAAPDVLLLSGWMDADYVQVARRWRERIPVVLTMDNWWTGGWKQRLAVAVSPWHLRRVYSRAWVPGEPQRTFARKLGFRNVATGFYCADVPAFDRAWEERAPEQRLLYIGRYLPFKGVAELWAAFAELADEFPGWTLDCIGAGDGWEDRFLHPQIQHHGFVQPADLTPFLSRAACAIVPSRREPWGVVVHELAAAGLPLIVSDAVGAAEQFVAPGRNGWVYPAGDGAALKAAMREAMAAADREAMGQASRDLACSWTPEKWAARALEVLAP